MSEEEGQPGEPQGPRLNSRLVVAELAYLVLAVIATVALDGVLRTTMWLFFLWLAIKTLIASRQ